MSQCFKSWWIFFTLKCFWSIVFILQSKYLYVCFENYFLFCWKWVGSLDRKKLWNGKHFQRCLKLTFLTNGNLSSWYIFLFWSMCHGFLSICPCFKKSSAFSFVSSTANVWKWLAWKGLLEKALVELVALRTIKAFVVSLLSAAMHKPTF